MVQGQFPCSRVSKRRVIYIPTIVKIIELHMNDNDRSSISAMGKCFIPSRYLSQHPEYFKIGSLVLLSRSSSLDDHDHDRGVGVSLELAKEPPAQICLCVVWPVAENPQMKNSLEHQEENLDEERLASVWYDGSITLNQSSCCSSSQWSQSLPLRVKGLNNQDRGGDTCGSSRSNLMMSKPHALSVYAVVPERIQLSVLWLTEIIIEQHEPLAALDLDLEEEEEEEEEESSPTRPLKPLFVHQRLKAALVRKYISLGSTIRTTTLTNGRRRRRMDDDSQHKRECREYHVTQISPEGTRSTRLFPTFYYIGPDTTIMISSSSSVAKEEEEDQPLPKTTLHKTSKPGKMMIAGYRHERSEIQDFITASVEYQDILRAFPALRLPRGLLIYGPSGVGKTQLIREICNELRVSSSSPRVSVTWTSASSVRSAPCPEAALVALFRGTTKTRVVVGTRSRSSPPPIRILVIDQLQLLCARRESSHSGSDENQSQTRIVAQLLTLLDGLMMMSPVQVIGICGESLETFDPALRRTGRFDRELEIKLPDVLTRREILARYHYLAPTTTTGPGGDSTHVAPTTERPPPQVNLLDQVARVSTGYSGSDLMSLCREARLIWLDRRRNQLLCHHRLFYRHWYVLFPLVIRSCLFQSFTRSLEEDHHHSAPPGLREYLLAMANTGASVLRSTASSSSASSSASSKVTWKDIGGHEEAKRVFQKSIEWPVAYAATFARLNLQPLSGILLYGPPGNSKTTFVKAAAEASGASFFSLCPADLYSPYFGEAEATIRKTFQRARHALPAIVFLDELDTLVMKRGNGGGEGESSSRMELRILSTLLNEMDGVVSSSNSSSSSSKSSSSSSNLLVIGATNRLELIDPALLRPGRFDRLIEIAQPSTQDRLEILQIHAQRIPMDDSCDLQKVAEETSGRSGAELENVIREAALHALRQDIHAKVVTSVHVQDVLQRKLG